MPRPGLRVRQPETLYDIGKDQSKSCPLSFRSQQSELSLHTHCSPLWRVHGVMSDSSAFAELMAVIIDRKENPPPRSYTTSLFQGGVPKIGGKIIEEASEVVEAAGEAVDTRHQHLVNESADLIYHLLVLLGHCDIPLSDVEAELRRRSGVSGLDEKAARGQKGGASE